MCLLNSPRISYTYNDKVLLNDFHAFVRFRIFFPIKQIDSSGMEIHFNQVSFPDPCNRSANCRFRGNMADTGAPGNPPRTGRP